MELTRAELFERIWSEPMGSVAARYGLTGNGLAKICDRLDIPRPPRSHWGSAGPPEWSSARTSYIPSS